MVAVALESILTCHTRVALQVLGAVAVDPWILDGIGVGASGTGPDRLGAGVHCCLFLRHEHLAGACGSWVLLLLCVCVHRHPPMPHTARPQGKPEEIIPNLKQNVWAAMLVNWKLWPAANFINFKFVPPQLQVLFANFVALIWNFYLSWATSRQVDVTERAIEQ